MNLLERIGVKITQDDDGKILKEKMYELPAEEFVQMLPLTTKSGVSNMTKEIIRKLKEN